MMRLHESCREHPSDIHEHSWQTDANYPDYRWCECKRREVLIRLEWYEALGSTTWQTHRDMENEAARREREAAPARTTRKTSRGG